MLSFLSAIISDLISRQQNNVSLWAVFSASLSHVTSRWQSRRAREEEEEEQRVAQPCLFVLIKWGESWQLPRIDTLPILVSVFGNVSVHPPPVFSWVQILFATALWEVLPGCIMPESGLLTLACCISLCSTKQDRPNWWISGFRDLCRSPSG